MSVREEASTKAAARTAPRRLCRTPGRALPLTPRRRGGQLARSMRDRRPSLARSGESAVLDLIIRGRRVVTPGARPYAQVCQGQPPRGNRLAGQQ